MPLKSDAPHFNGCLYSAAPWASLSGAPICALEHLVVLRPLFDEVCLVLCEEGPLQERAQQLNISSWCSPLQFRGLRKGGLFRFLTGIGPVVRSRWAYVSKLRRQLKVRPGVLHIHSRATHLPYALLAGRWAGVPVVVTLHEPWEGGLEALIDLFWVRLLATQVVFLSQAMLDQYPRLMRQTPSVVYNSHPAVPERVSPARERPLVAMAARMGKAKGSDVFLETCRLLRDRGNVFEAWLAGGWACPQEQADAHAFVKEHRLEDVVSVRGAISDMDSLYLQMEVLLFPSRRDSFPRVVMEAMSYGIPAVATRVDGIPEMVEDGVTGFLVDSGDAPEFARCVERLLKEDALRKEMGEAARTRAQACFAPEAYRSAMATVYRKAKGMA